MFEHRHWVAVCWQPLSACLTLKVYRPQGRMPKRRIAKAEAETVRIGNTEQATRILMENIVEPLKKELS